MSRKARGYCYNLLLFPVRTKNWLLVQTTQVFYSPCCQLKSSTNIMIFHVNYPYFL